MELSIFHKIVLALAIFIVSIGIVNSVSNNLLSSYSEIATIATKYNLVEAESLFAETPKLFSGNWLRHAMVSSFLSITDQPVSQTETTDMLLKLDNSAPFENIYLLKFPKDANIAGLQKDLQSIQKVQFVEPNYEIELQTATTTLSATAPNNQKLQLSSEDPTSDLIPGPNSTAKIKVGIVDSGIDHTHSDFQDKSIHTFSVFENTQDSVGHGTHLSGLVFKYAPEAELYSYKFTDGKVGKLSNLIKALRQAHQDDLNIVNLSLGLPTPSQLLADTVTLFSEDQVIVVSAAGNLNTNLEFYPAAYDQVIAVGSLYDNGAKYQTSNYGEWLKYSLNGHNITSTAPDNKYKTLSGTSQSAAIFTGILANYLAPPPPKNSLEDYLKDYALDFPDIYQDLLGTRINLPALTSAAASAASGAATLTAPTSATAPATTPAAAAN